MSSAAGVGAEPVPHGFTVRCSCDDDAAVLWHEVVSLPDGRVGVAVGHVDDPDRRERLRSDLRTGRWEDLAVVSAGPGSDRETWVVVCGVIDRPGSRISYLVAGDRPDDPAGPPAPVVAAPDSTHRRMAPEAGRPGTAELAPGATVLFCTGPADRAGALLDEYPAAHPDQLADHLIRNLAPGPHPGVVAVLYRHPPLPLVITAPALAGNLAGLRDRLRSWLALAGVGGEVAADVVLAVGEAASNAVEHAGAAVIHGVTLTVHARVAEDGLRCTVSDDGRWRTPPEDPGHRGHGLRLIRALVDTADLTAAEHGTTVEMFKELR